MEGEKNAEDRPARILTIGHSTFSFEYFIDLLKKSGVSAIADVRSSPFSRRLPHFNRDDIRSGLKEKNIKYVFLGQELGGRPRSPDLYCNGIADYEKMARQPEFIEGITRIIAGSKRNNIALMCSEHNPLDCHRCLLVGRALIERHVSVGHILKSGRIAEQEEIEEKLLSLSGKSKNDMFLSREERLSQSYMLRAKNVAYREDTLLEDNSRPSEWFNHAN